MSRLVWQVGALALLAAILIHAFQVLLLAFAGVLAAVVLRGGADALAERTGIAPGWSLALICTLVLAALAAGIWSLAPEVAVQARQLSDDVPRLWNGIEGRLKDLLGARFVEQVTDQVTPSGDGSMQDLLSRTFGILSASIGVAGNLLVILLVGLYLAADPHIYRRGALRLVPPTRRKRAAEVLEASRGALMWWMIGKFGSMSVVGALTYAGLLWLGVPLALSLSLVAALLTFVPNFGPVAAAIPAVLIATQDGMSAVLKVSALYLVVQLIETYLVTPFIQQRTVSLPPALTILTQLVLGLAGGVAGLTLAAPITAVGLVVVRMLYVEDVVEADGRDDA
jgi:predicted PurR-regulated permease PerM